MFEFFDWDDETVFAVRQKSIRKTVHFNCLIYLYAYLIDLIACFYFSVYLLICLFVYLIVRMRILWVRLLVRYSGLLLCLRVCSFVDSLLLHLFLYFGC